jgi:hypothetical protein
MVRVRWSMPPSVIYVVVAVCALLLNDVLTNMGPNIVGGLLVAGMVTGHRLAWQLGRVLTPVAAIWMLLVSLAALPAREGDIRNSTVALISAAILLSIFLALGRRAAKVYFQLLCPRCGTFTNKPGDFFFNTAYCTNCNLRWRSQAEYFRKAADVVEDEAESPAALPADVSVLPPDAITRKSGPDRNG